MNSPSTEQQRKTRVKILWWTAGIISFLFYFTLPIISFIASFAAIWLHPRKGETLLMNRLNTPGNYKGRVFISVGILVLTIMSFSVISSSNKIKNYPIPDIKIVSSRDHLGTNIDYDLKVKVQNADSVFVTSASSGLQRLTKDAEIEGQFYINIPISSPEVTFVVKASNRYKGASQPLILTRDKNELDVKKEEEIKEAQQAKIEVNVQVNEERKTLNYEIIHQVRGQRYDGGVILYVLVDGINLSNDSFKKEVKKLIDEIVRTKGNKISIEFHSNREALDLSYSEYGNNSLGRILTPYEIDKIGETYFAAFSGELEIEVFLNTIYFFPGAFTDNAKVGKYVGYIEYNPNK